MKMNQDCNNNSVNRYVNRSLMFDQQNNSKESDIYKIRTHNKHKIIFGQLNVNSLRNTISNHKKHRCLFGLGNYSWPIFSYIAICTPYRLDRDKYGGNLMLYVHNDFLSKLIKSESSYEGFFVEPIQKSKNG